MDRERINELLDSVFEFEGLLRLASDREDDSLLDERVESSARRLEGLICETYPDEERTETARDADAEAVADDASEPDEASEVMFYQIEDKEVSDAAETDNQEEVDNGPEADKAADGGNAAPAKRKPAFSINDRFRFKRELFNNSDRKFDNALAVVAGMESYDEAEDYFYGDLDWDPDNSEVAAFMEIVSKYLG